MWHFHYAKILWEPRDLWVGVFWDKDSSYPNHGAYLDIYICLIPMLPLYIVLHRTEEED